MMKRILAAVLCIMMAAGMTGISANASEADEPNAYELTGDFYIKAAEALTAEASSRITEYHIAELYSTSEEVVKIIEEIGQELSAEWSGIYLVHYNTEDIFAGIWGADGISGPEMSDELLEELMEEHSASEVLRNAAMQKMEINDIAAVMAAGFGQIFITEDIPYETSVFLLNEDCSYNVMISFYEIEDNILSAYVQPMPRTQVEYVMGYLENNGCELEKVSAIEDTSIEKTLCIASDELTEEGMLEMSEYAAERLLAKYKYSDYLAAVGVQDSLTDLCIEINKDIEGGLGQPTVYRINSAQVWDLMYDLSEMDEDSVPEEYKKAVEYMKSTSVVENLALQYIASAGQELLALSTTVTAYNYEIKHKEAGIETAIIFSGGEKYSVLVIVNRMSSDAVSYTAEIVPAGIEAMIAQLSTGDPEFLK